MVRYRFRGCDESAEIPFGAAEDVENAITTLVTLLALGMEPARISYALGRLRRVGTRMAVSDGVNDCLVAFDSYTCDLASLESALDFVYRRQKAAHDHRTSTLILSDLHHDPGVSAADVCSGIASLLRRAGVSRFIGVGPELGRNAALFPEDARFFADTDEMMQSLSTSDFSYEYILLKGAPEYEFTRMLHNLEARTHETVLEVNLDSIVRNFNYFRSHLPSSTGIVAMVKGFRLRCRLAGDSQNAPVTGGVLSGCGRARRGDRAATCRYNHAYNGYESEGGQLPCRVPAPS